MINWTFLIQGLRHPKQVGTIVPCSPYIGRAMASCLEPALSGTYIEFGGGQGVITREILKNIPEGSMLLCFEINPSLCKHLKRIQDARLQVVNDTAENLESHLIEMEEPRAIVSTLPLATMDSDLKKRILKVTINNLGSNPFIQYQYFGQDEETLREYFKHVESHPLFSWRVIPRGVIYVCRN